ncbi:MAG: protein kinase [Sandaracinaceae bacterium]|nr:protein kinase [Sandaracinaceae bacterium]
MKLASGSIFARDFRVLQPLAEGGMGAVYAVEQLSTGKRRALKVMQPALIPDARARERFVLEARIGSQIESEHVVDVVASGIDEPTGMPWIAMELLEGVDLSDYVKQRDHLSPQETYEVLSQLCDGLGAAHARGIVHRDLKPENVFISTSKRRGVPFIVKILDFGIAKVTHENQTSATGTSAMGSPLWMAPEQTESGTRLRPATDVWALGLMAFWMLTGRSYWRAGNSAEIALTPVFTEVLVLPLDPPSVRAAQMALGHLVPPAFDAWFFRCVSRNHDLRFVDATQAIQSLSPYFTFIEASSARRMIPATVAMPSVPPPAFGSSPGVLASVGAPTPLPHTSAQPSVEYSPQYTPKPTEPTPVFVPPTMFAGSIPPGVPLHATLPQGGSLPPSAPTPSAHAAPFAPSFGPSMTPSTTPSMTPSYAPSVPPSFGHAGTPSAAPYAHQAVQVASASQPVATARPLSTEGTVRWGVIGVLGATLVLGVFVAAGLAFVLLRPSVAPPPPSSVASLAPDAAVPVIDAATIVATAEPDAGPSTVSSLAPVPHGERGEHPQAGGTGPGLETGSGVGTETGETAGDPTDSSPFPDDASRRFVGTWGDGAWRYRLMIDLVRDGSTVQGAIRWTLAETPDEMYTARIGETATEYVRGTFSAPGQITLEGTSVTDDSLITADHYDLVIANDGALSGSAREGGGRLSARALD